MIADSDGSLGAYLRLRFPPTWLEAKYGMVNNVNPTLTLTSYYVGRPNHMEFAELDGEAGDEMLFTSLRAINTFPQPAQVTVLDFRLKKVQTFSVGAASSYKLVPRRGKAGNDVVFQRNTGAPVTIFYNDATHTFAKR